MDREVGDLMAVAIRGFELYAEASLAIVQLGALGGVFGLIDLAVHSQFQQCGEFGFDLIGLPPEFFAVLLVVSLPRVGAGADHVHEPLVTLFIEFDRGE